MQNIKFAVALSLPPLSALYSYRAERQCRKCLVIGHMTPYQEKASYVTALGWAPTSGYLGTLNLRTILDSQILTKHESIQTQIVTEKEIHTEN